MGLAMNFPILFTGWVGIALETGCSGTIFYSYLIFGVSFSWNMAHLRRASCTLVNSLKSMFLCLCLRTVPPIKGFFAILTCAFIIASSSAFSFF